VFVTVANKHTRDRSWSKFVGCSRGKVWETEITIDTEMIIGRRCAVEEFMWG
jgi:hypothetical protein